MNPNDIIDQALHELLTPKVMPKETPQGDDKVLHGEGTVLFPRIRMVTDVNTTAGNHVPHNITIEMVTGYAPSTGLYTVHYTYTYCFPTGEKNTSYVTRTFTYIPLLTRTDKDLLDIFVLATKKDFLPMEWMTADWQASFQEMFPFSRGKSYIPTVWVEEVVGMLLTERIFRFTIIP